MTNKKYKMFVYGTLRPEAEATHVLQGYSLFNYYDKYPYILETNDGHDVVGNVIEVTDKQLDKLDHIEGVERGLFKRETVYVYLVNDPDDDNELEAFVYVAGDIVPPVIESGDWFKR